MIPGLDSSFARPNVAQAAAAYAAGIRAWGGYLGTRGGLGLATLWDQAAFQIVKDAGMTAIGFCSGWDDPGAIRALAAAWGVLPCVDVETGIRTDGLWLDDWLPVAGAGLYGLASVHYEVGRPIGRGAAFNIVADYLTVGCTGESWPSWLLRPAGPCGWQCQGDHQEFGLEVDRNSLDDWFAQGVDMTQEEHDTLMAVKAMLTFGNSRPAAHDGDWLWGISDGTPGGDRLTAILAKVQTPPTVDVNALAAALAPHLPPAVDTVKLIADLEAALPGLDAAAVMAAFKAQLAKP